MLKFRPCRRLWPAKKTADEGRRGHGGAGVKYWNEVKGFNSRLDPLQAAMLRVKLRHLDDWNDRRKALAAQYLAGLADSGLALPAVPDWADPVWHVFVVRHPQREPCSFASARPASAPSSITQSPRIASPPMRTPASARRRCRWPPACPTRS